MNWTLEILEQKKKSGKIRDYTLPGKEQPKKSKYGNKKTEVNGEKFDSKREATRYRDLLLLLKAGKIGMLQRQVSYELNGGGSHSLRYVADFVYVDAETGETVVEDSKGCVTREFKKKRRLMKKVHGITIKEV